MQSDIVIKDFENMRFASSIFHAYTFTQLLVVPWVLRISRSSRIHNAISFNYYGLRGHEGFKGLERFTGSGLTSVLKFSSKFTMVLRVSRVSRVSSVLKVPRVWNTNCYEHHGLRVYKGFQGFEGFEGLKRFNRPSYYWLPILCVSTVVNFAISQSIINTESVLRLKPEKLLKPLKPSNPTSLRNL